MIENKTYVLSNFEVLPNNLLFKASEHKYTLRWTGGTIVEETNTHQIPHVPIKFKPFAEIVAGKWHPDILVGMNI